MPTVGNIKGTAIPGTSTNVKRMSGGSDAVHVLVGGEYVYGEWSSAKTDIINFDHYYTPDGQSHDLGELCKCWAGNLAVIEEDEPTDPPVDPDPGGGTVWVKGIVEDKDENGNVTARYETDLVEAKKVS